MAWWANALLKSADDMRFRGIICGEENENLSFGLLCIIEITLNVFRGTWNNNLDLQCCSWKGQCYT